MATIQIEIASIVVEIPYFLFTTVIVYIVVWKYSRLSIGTGGTLIVAFSGRPKKRQQKCKKRSTTNFKGLNINVEY